MSDHNRMLAGAAFCWLCLAALTPAAPPETADEVVKLARARQEKVKTLDVKLKQTEILPPGSFNKGNKAFPPVPKERTVFTSECRLLLSGKQIRFEGNSTHTGVDRTLEQRRAVVVFDGAVTTALCPSGVQRDGSPFATVRKEDRLSGSVPWEAWPVLMTCRGAEPALAYVDFRQYKPSDVVAPVDGVTCRRFDREWPGPSTERLWIDESGLIRQKQTLAKGKVGTQFDVRYERRYGFDAFPASWRRVGPLPLGVGDTETTVEVVEAAVNQPIADSAFNLRFPPGCQVYDDVNHTEYVVPADGGKANLERPKAEVEPPMAAADLSPEEGPLVRYRGLIAVGLGALLLIVMMGCLRRARSHNAPPGPPSPP